MQGEWYKREAGRQGGEVRGTRLKNSMPDEGAYRSQWNIDLEPFQAAFVDYWFGV